MFSVLRTIVYKTTNKLSKYSVFMKTEGVYINSEIIP